MPQKQSDRLSKLPTRTAAFIEPMECLQVPSLPDGPNWLYEIKLDGIALLRAGQKTASPFSPENAKSLNKRFPFITEPLRDLPPGTVLDGELVALDDFGRPVFNLLQNFKAEADRIRYFVFDVMCHEGHGLTKLPQH
jgi:bifunctional non-homologous end joining protein LigD